LLTVNARIKFGPDAPEMDAPAARLYLFDVEDKIEIGTSLSRSEAGNVIPRELATPLPEWSHERRSEQRRNDGRDHGRGFMPGRSGNPGGRREGFGSCEP
jgi:hypothetical protein